MQNSNKYELKVNWKREKSGFYRGAGKNSADIWIRSKKNGITTSKYENGKLVHIKRINNHI